MHEPDSNPTELDQLTEAFLTEHRSGHGSSVHDFAKKHPAVAEELETILPAALAMEGLKRQQQQQHMQPQFLQTDGLQRLGDFRILNEVGRGGMGIVYAAEQESLGRKVAVKVLPTQMLLDPRRLQRFQQEAQTAARLHHTNIVPIFGVGEQDGYHYYVMQLITGQGLHHWLQEQKPGTEHWRQVADMGMQAADALAYAHSQEVLHRDIKPANLLLDQQQNLWITDFGLAKAMQDADLTRSQDLVGTLQYMAPEQLNGIYDQRSDIFCLGLTLYELAALQPAYAHMDRGEILSAVAKVSLQPLHRAQPLIPKDLEVIISKCLAAEPRHRYASASELRQDLENFLHNRPIAARHLSSLQKLQRWCRLNRSTASLILVSAVAVIALAITGWTSFVSERARSAQVRLANQQAKSNLALAESNMDLALQAFDDVFDELAGPDILQPVLRSEASSEENDEANSEARSADNSDDNSTADVAYNTPPHRVVSNEEAAVLQLLLTFYDRFAEKNAGNPQLLQETARAHHRMGDIFSSLGQLDLASQSYLAALGRYQALERDGLTATTAQQANIYNELGHCYQTLGKIRQAQEAFLQVTQLAAPKSLSQHYELARAHDALGTPRPSRQARVIEQQCKEHLHTALELAQGLIILDPDEPTFRLCKARSSRHLAQLLRREPSTASHARDMHAQAIALLEALVDDFPETAHFRYELAETYASQGSPDNLEKAYDISAALQQDQPGNPEYCLSLALIQTKMARQLLGKNQLQQAEVHLSKALELQSSLTLQYPSNSFYWRMLAVSHRNLADIKQRLGKHQEAEHHQQQAKHARQRAGLGRPPRRGPRRPR